MTFFMEFMNEESRSLDSDNDSLVHKNIILMRIKSINHEKKQKLSMQKYHVEETNYYKK